MWSIVQGSFRRIATLLCALVLLLNIFVSVVSADVKGCPKGMSQLDCAAIFGPWENWIPDSGSSSCGDTASSTTLPGGDNKEKAFNYFVGKGLNEIQAAAIIGNLIVESSLNTSADQPGGAGMGIAQWSNPGRWNQLEDFASQQGRDKFDLGLQLDYMWHEIESTDTYAKALENTKKQTTIEDATAWFMGTAEAGLHPGNVVDPVSQSYIDKYGRFVGYENPGTPHLDLRITAAKAVQGSFGDGSVSGTNSTSGACADGSVSCGGTVSASVREAVVCLAQAELALWKGGQLKQGHDYFKYSENTDEFWCADFVSWLYKQAGYPIGTESAWRVPAVAGIKSIGELDQKFHYHDAAGYTPRPGDLVIHLSGESHVNIVTSVNTSTSSLTMIGGDQPPLNDAGYPNGSSVSEYTVSAFSVVDGITGYVSPD